MPKTRELTLPSRIESIEKAATEAETFARDSGFGDDAIFAIDAALREAVTNAIKHGNKFDESKPVEVRFETSDEALGVEVRDFGEGFEHDAVPDPTDPDNLLKASGRGIFFMRTFMDEIEWSHPEGGGTAVKMLKKL